jgi:hypothetical protein
MKLPFLDPLPSHTSITGPPLGAILQELCDRRQHLLLSTPYLNFEARFLERKDQELRLRVMLGKEAVKHALTPNPLRIRLAWALTFYAGATHILGYEQEENRRVLRVQVPETLELNEQRRAFRVERVGRSIGAISSTEGIILRVSLENLSRSGAGIFALEPLPSDVFRAARFIDLSLPLDQGPSLNLHGRICHVDGQSLGLAFHPPATGTELDQLTQWLASRELEAQQRWENRMELRAQAERAARPKEAPAGILMLTSNNALKDQVALILKEIQPVHALCPAMGPLMETRFQPPLLALIDISGASAEDRHRIRTLVESVDLNAPMVILGDGRESEAGRRLAQEMKAATYLDWNAQQEVFFRRLIRGLIHHRWKYEIPGE